MNAKNKAMMIGAAAGVLVMIFAPDIYAQIAQKMGKNVEVTAAGAAGGGNG